MLDRQIVRRDVGSAIREAVIQCTKNLFTYKTYKSSLVPKKEPMKGWGAKRANWGIILGVVMEKLHHMKPEYKVLQVNAHDAIATLKKPLSDTSELLTNKIMKGNAQL